jgi:hypothetical protein
LLQAGQPSLDLSIIVSDIGKTAGTFGKVLGFVRDGDWFIVPGGSTRIRLTKATGSAACSAPPFPSPGRASLRLSVHDIAGMAAKLKDAGLSVVTTSGVPVKLPYNGPMAMILREPSGFGLQLIENEMIRSELAPCGGRSLL